MTYWRFQGLKAAKIEISPEWVDMVTVERQLNEMFASQAKAKNITLLFQRQYEEKYVFIWIRCASIRFLSI